MTTPAIKKNYVQRIVFYMRFTSPVEWSKWQLTISKSPFLTASLIITECFIK